MDVDNVKGSEVAIDKLIRFSMDEKLPTSFFITGQFAKLYPKETLAIYEAGYDIGIHGWDHGIDGTEDFRTNSYEEQKSRIVNAIEAISDVTGNKPLMNRCPDLWVSETTIRVLIEQGIKLDSSVPSKRLLGRVRTLKYLFSPSTPYYPALDNLAKISKQRDILEIPPSALVFPINLSALRFFGLNVMKTVVNVYSKLYDDIVFYGHPAEYLEPHEIDFETDKPVKRHVENIGPHVFDITKKFIDYIKTLGYNPSRLSDLINK